MIGGIVLVTTAVVVALWWAGTAGLDGDKLVTARLDALRTGLSIGLGGGGALALYLSWRRQRAAEITLAQAAIALAQNDRDHDHAETDARERRITDLYTKAVEQLGSDKAPVRLGGLYALARLAQDNPPHRQTTVNVLCAYLRMPYLLPGEQPPDDAETSTLDRYRERVQEREVRLTAQRILGRHLRAKDHADNPVETFWPGIDVDLRNAVLIEVNFYRATIRAAFFDNAKFVGKAGFSGTEFGLIADFSGSKFDGAASFESMHFENYAVFGRVTFSEAVDFSMSEFNNAAFFSGAHFGDTVDFSGARFGSDAYFEEAHFCGVAQFGNVEFDEGVPAEVANLQSMKTDIDP